MFLFEPRYRPLPPPLMGKRVRLRPPLPGDFAGWSDLRRQSRAFLEPWEPTWGEEALSRAVYRARQRRMVREWNADLGYAFHLLATEQSDVGARPGVVLGGINLNQVRRLSAQSASLGYWMGAPYAGLGLMREALELLLPYAFAGAGAGEVCDPAIGLGLHRIDAACIPENQRSRRLLTGLGFREIGLAPRYLKINGDWRDHVCHQMLADDFAARRGGASFPQYLADA